MGTRPFTNSGYLAGDYIQLLFFSRRPIIDQAAFYHIFPVFRAGLLALFLLLASSCRQQESGLRKVGNHRLYFEIMGKGSPAVVIDVGLGESYSRWEPIIDSISRVTRVFVYDRAGYGQSEPGPEPRDARTEAAELHALLKKAGVNPPYLLAGHSLGALNLQVFAAGYPDEVFGMVLLDPSPKGWINGEGFPELQSMIGRVTEEFRMMAEQAGNQGGEEGHRQALFFRTLASEQGSLLNLTARQVKEINSFGNIPLTVIGSGIPNPQFGETAAAFQESWISESRELAGLSSRGKFILAEESTHMIQIDVPDLVISSILELLASRN